MEINPNREATPTICLIESHPDVKRIIEAMLAQKGYWTCSFDNHDKALSVLPTLSFDVMICCSSPRHISCEDFAREAKKLQPDTPIIVATSANDHPNLDKSEVVDKVIDKPFTLQELDDMISFLIRMKDCEDNLDMTFRATRIASAKTEH